jgi:hypothetical protein
MKIVHVVPSADRMHPGRLNIIKTAVLIHRSSLIPEMAF